MGLGLLRIESERADKVGKKILTELLAQARAFLLLGTQ